MTEQKIQYISDEMGNLQGVLVPIELWQDLIAERETTYLLKSETMKQRLIEAMQRQNGIPFEENVEPISLGK